MSNTADFVIRSSRHGKTAIMRDVMIARAAKGDNVKLFCFSKRDDERYFDSLGIFTKTIYGDGEVVFGHPNGGEIHIYYVENPPSHEGGIDIWLR